MIKTRIKQTTPKYVGTSLNPNSKRVLLGMVAKLKYEQIEQKKKDGEIRSDTENNLELWLWTYSNHTKVRLKNELILLNGNPTQ